MCLEALKVGADLDRLEIQSKYAEWPYRNFFGRINCDHSETPNVLLLNMEKKNKNLIENIVHVFC
jgi:hypothetical protein